MRSLVSEVASDFHIEDLDERSVPFWRAQAIKFSICAGSRRFGAIDVETAIA